jgi:hypothetical protein
VSLGAELDLPAKTAARIAAAVPENTRRNWESRWRAFALWCLLTERTALPATAETLAAYLDARTSEMAVPSHLRHAVGPSSLAAHLGSLRARGGRGAPGHPVARPGPCRVDRRD